MVKSATEIVQKQTRSYMFYLFLCKAYGIVILITMYGCNTKPDAEAILERNLEQSKRDEN